MAICTLFVFERDETMDIKKEYEAIVESQKQEFDQQLKEIAQWENQKNELEKAKEELIKAREKFSRDFPSEEVDKKQGNGCLPTLFFFLILPAFLIWVIFFSPMKIPSFWGGLILGAIVWFIALAIFLSVIKKINKKYLDSYELEKAKIEKMQASITEQNEAFEESDVHLSSDEAQACFEEKLKTEQRVYDIIKNVDFNKPSEIVDAYILCSHEEESEFADRMIELMQDEIAQKNDEELCAIALPLMVEAKQGRIASTVNGTNCFAYPAKLFYRLSQSENSDIQDKIKGIISEMYKAALSNESYQSTTYTLASALANAGFGQFVAPCKEMRKKFKSTSSYTPSYSSYSSGSSSSFDAKSYVDSKGFTWWSGSGIDAIQNDSSLTSSQKEEALRYYNTYYD